MSGPRNPRVYSASWHPASCLLWVANDIPGLLSSEWTLALQDSCLLHEPRKLCLLSTLWHCRSFVIWLDSNELWSLIAPWNPWINVLCVDPEIPRAVLSRCHDRCLAKLPTISRKWPSIRGHVGVSIHYLLLNFECNMMILCKICPS